MLRILPYAHTKDSFCCLQSLILHSALFQNCCRLFWLTQTDWNGLRLHNTIHPAFAQLYKTQALRILLLHNGVWVGILLLLRWESLALQYQNTCFKMCSVWLNTNSRGFELAWGVEAPTLYVVWTTDPLSRYCFSETD